MTPRWAHMPPGAVFVFGSNTGGRHGKGAALTARTKFGAIYGQGEGRQGQSYAVPTKNGKLEVLPLIQIKRYVEVFLTYAADHPDETFYVTALGTGLAGYRNRDIAPMFRQVGRNCILPPEWVELLRLKPTKPKGDTPE